MGCVPENSDLVLYLELRKSRVEEALAGYLPEADHSSLVRAMRYAIFSGGKRIRPLLCIAAAEACGGDIAQVLPTACALELIHGFSLVHDDLPALDDDAVRRGHPTCHMQFGEAVAILAGDALLARGFELFGEQEMVCAPRPTLRALRVISNALGVAGMVAGEVADLEAEGKDVSRQDLERIHRLKTAALIRASTAAGAILVGAAEEVISALADFGEALGLAFQIQDDVLGASGDPVTMGKPVGKDVERGKATYPRIIGFHDTVTAVETQIDVALACLARFDERAKPLRQIALSTLQRDR
jgi:geranylgeranyl diphosphate synthase type II